MRCGELSPSSVGVASEGAHEAPEGDVTEGDMHSESDIKEEEEEEEEVPPNDSPPFGRLFDSLTQSLLKVCSEYSRTELTNSEIPCTKSPSST